MGHIESVSVTDLGSRRGTVTHTLDRRTNVFWGLNGSGKTTLLKILHSSLIDDASILAKSPFRSAEVVFYSSAYEMLFSRRISKDEIDSVDIQSRPSRGSSWGEARLSSEKNRVPWHTEVIGGRSAPKRNLRAADFDRLTHGYLPISRVDSDVLARTRFEYGYAPLSIDEGYLDDIFGTQVQQKWQAYSRSALESIQEIQQQGIGEILSILFGGIGVRRSSARTPSRSSEPIASLDDVDAAFSLVTGFLRSQKIPIDFDLESFSHQLSDDPKMKRIIGRIQDVDVRRDEATRPQRELARVIELLYSGSKKVLFTAGGIEIKIDGGKKIPVEQLSSGERQLLHILLETMTSKQSPIIIDEPELSMHVDWQRELVGAMHAVNRDCQAILATHSPEVMAYVPDDCIFEL